jgi:hypothetical protein
VEKFLYVTGGTTKKVLINPLARNTPIVVIPDTSTTKNGTFKRLKCSTPHTSVAGPGKTKLSNPHNQETLIAAMTGNTNATLKIKTIPAVAIRSAPTEPSTILTISIHLLQQIAHTNYN